MYPRILCFIFALLLATAFVRPASAEVFGPNITFAVKSGKVYGYKNPFDRWYPASITKMMTTYVALREVKSGRVTLKSPVRQSAQSLSNPPSKMGFPVGTVLTLEAAIKIILVKSANDVASAIAESVGGSEEQFSRLMNKYAREIGMISSNFINPHGLHHFAQYSSAYDLAILARQIYLEFPEHADLFGMQAIQVGKRKYRNHNALMRQYPGTIGMKTGFICAGGLSLVTASKQKDDILVSIVLGATSGKERNVLAAELQTSALKRIETDSLANLDSLEKPVNARQPVDISDYVCKKKRRTSANLLFDDPAIEFYAVKTLPLADRQKLYLSNEPKPYTAEIVKLGGATGPDPFELLVEKPPLDLTQEFAEGSDEFEPDQRVKASNGKMVSIPTFRPSE